MVVAPTKAAPASTKGTGPPYHIAIERSINHARRTVGETAEQFQPYILPLSWNSNCRTDKSDIGSPTIRLLHIGIYSFNLPVLGEKRGGIERVAHDLAQGLARRGHQVTIWSTDLKPAGAAYQVRQLPWRRLSENWLGRRLLIGYLGNILAVLPKYEQCDVIIAHGDSLFLPLRGKPIVRVVHGSALAEARNATSLWRFVHQSGVYVFELLTGLIQAGTVGVSHNTLRYNPFIKRVIPNGIDLSLYRSTNERKTTNPSILFVGALEGRKRGRLLLEWFDRDIRKRHPDATLAMVGPPGPQVRGVKYFTGISDAELASLYRRSWVYATPSSYEGFGLPYVEAMASGTPVIASPNPGSREVLDEGRYGLLAGDSDFPKALGDLLGDVPLRSHWAKLGLERAQNYSLETMLDRYEALMAELCGPTTGGRLGEFSAKAIEGQE